MRFSTSTIFAALTSLVAFPSIVTAGLIDIVNEQNNDPRRITFSRPGIPGGEPMPFERVFTKGDGQFYTISAGVDVPLTQGQPLTVNYWNSAGAPQVSQCFLYGNLNPKWDTVTIKFNNDDSFLNPCGDPYEYGVIMRCENNPSTCAPIHKVKPPAHLVGSI